VTSLPIAIGFGISLPGHVSILGGLADAAVVGSALVAEIDRAGSTEAACQAITKLVTSLKQAARKGMSRRGASPRGVRG
jgi:tryptophan synthase alpha chain